MTKVEYIIVGDCGKYTDCLVELCGTDYNKALVALAKYQKEGYNNHTNFRIKEEVSKTCWWNDPYLVH